MRIAPAAYIRRHVGMADDADSKSVVGNHVWVQVPLPALKIRSTKVGRVFYWRDAEFVNGQAYLCGLWRFNLQNRPYFVNIMPLERAIVNN